MSKGSGRRPTDEQKYAANWDAVFGKKEPVEYCSNPFCNCPFDAGPEDDWCARGLPHKKEEKK